MNELAERLADTLAGRYLVDGEVGRGGMAVVYRATDVRHGRVVAIKVLRPELAGAIGAERFLREVRLVSQLVHPHILPVHDSGDEAGLLYFVMPYVDGESLRERLRRQAQLGLDDALRVAREVADALAYSHGRGIIHRDVKPENILLSAETGHAVVTDFGIAKALEDVVGEERLTSTGLSVGTPAYMSPEQAAGERRLDARTDVYALGTVLYEMLAGEPPFTGSTAQSVLAKRMTQAAAPIQVLRPNVPEPVARTIARALEMVPADRFATAAGFRAALESEALASSSSAHAAAPAARSRGAGGLAGLAPLSRAVPPLALAAIVAIGFLGYQRFRADPGPTRIVVLPFENLGSGDDAYLTDGIVGELTNHLAGVGSLEVIARTSAAQYRDRRRTAREIGRELNVHYLVEGSVRRARTPGDHDSVHLNARLVRTRDDTQVWADNYHVEGRGIFALQSAIAEQVTAKLDVVLRDPERRRLARVGTQDLQAYDYYLRGDEHYNRSWSRPDVEGAVRMYERAVEIDPTYGLAYAKLAQAHAWMHQLRYDLSEDRLVAAKRAADRAIALDPDLPEAHVALGLYYYWGRSNYERAIDEFTIAKELQPSNAQALLQIGNVRRRQGRFDEAIENYRQSANLDPRSHRAWFNLGETLLFTRQYEQARPHLERVTALAPEFLEGYSQRARLAMSADGDLAAAQRILQQAEERIPPAAWRSPMLDFIRVIHHPQLDDFLRRIRPGAYGLDSATYHITKGQMLRQLGHGDPAVVQLDSARVHLERMREDRPDQAWIHGLLGVAYAGVGRAEEAIWSAERAEQLLPVSDDALDGPEFLSNLGRVHAMLGNEEKAIEYYARVLAIPSWVSGNSLRLDPALLSLRAHPGFQSLVARGR
ncbi:MAG TPA: protein kinase [Gemmatimonadaceae bacterium]|nr:protein kinase [Gemmatimonadaceae bacterium]